MNLHDRTRFLLLLSLLIAAVFCVGLLQPALAHIYAYTSSDGTVKLSNVPEDDRYTVLVAETEGSQAVEAAGLRKPPSGMAGKALFDIAVDEVARTYGLESALLHAVISVESRYRPTAVSSKGAAGLMQLMPAVTQQYGVSDPFDPVQNLHGGAKYLRDLLRAYDNDVNLALAAYNAGRGAVSKYGNRIPPYPETMKYVPKVLDFYRMYQGESVARGRVGSSLSPVGDGLVLSPGEGLGAGENL